jgi:hypothetical protein
MPPLPRAVLTDEQPEDIRLGLASGLRGPVLLKWCEALLADRDERRTRERAQRRPWPGRSHIATQPNVRFVCPGCLERRSGGR